MNLESTQPQTTIGGGGKAIQKADNELVTASEAKELLNITISKPDNQCVTYGDLKQIASSAQTTVGNEFVKRFSSLILSETVRDGRIHMYNSTSQEVQLAPASYPNAAITVRPYLTAASSLTTNTVINVPKNAVVICKYANSGYIKCECVNSHRTFDNLSWAVVIL